jgi:hypothetical protein
MKKLTKEEIDEQINHLGWPIDEDGFGGSEVTSMRKLVLWAQDELEKRNPDNFPGPPSEECVWIYGNKWHGFANTTCGNRAYGMSDKYLYCPFCGKKRKQVKNGDIEEELK